MYIVCISSCSVFHLYQLCSFIDGRPHARMVSLSLCCTTVCVYTIYVYSMYSIYVSIVSSTPTHTYIPYYNNIVYTYRSIHGRMKFYSSRPSGGRVFLLFLWHVLWFNVSSTNKQYYSTTVVPTWFTVLLQDLRSSSSGRVDRGLSSEHSVTDYHLGFLATPWLHARTNEWMHALIV